MSRPAGSLTAIFAFLMAVTLGGIVLHQVTGYDYPTSALTAYEVNVINDIYEAFILVPIGLAGLAAWRKGNPWGPVLIAGVSSTLAYNYLLISTGRQNPWILLWTLKLSLASLALCMAWTHLPLGPGWAGRARHTMASYLAVVVALFSPLMGARLWASAQGVAMEMSMQIKGPADWAEPFVRDPIIFLAFVVPLFLAACVGLWLGADWGARAAALSATFMVNMVIMILMTGPIKELLQMGALSAGMLPISLLFVSTAAPAVWALVWLTRTPVAMPTAPVAASAK